MNAYAFRHSFLAGPPMPLEAMPPLAEREAVGLRLRAARKDAALTTAQGAEAGGVSVTQLGAIERGVHSLTSMSAGNLGRLPAAFGLNWPAFLAIVGPTYSPYIPFLTEDPRPHAQDGAVPLLVKNKTVLPVYDMAAASPGGIGVHVIPVKNIEVDPQFVRSTTRAYLVLGDSMDNGTRDSIADGDVVLINEGDCDLKDGKTFIVKVPGNGVLVKRVRTYPDGETYLTSDNPNYRPIRPDEAQIIGRVYRHIPAERDM